MFNAEPVVLLFCELFHVTAAETFLNTVYCHDRGFSYHI